jgi:hypothetical protein
MNVIRELPYFARTPEPRIRKPHVAHLPVMGICDEDPRALLEEYDTLLRRMDFCKWLNARNPQTGRRLAIRGKVHERIRKKLGYKQSHAVYARLHQLDHVAFLRALDEEDERYERELTRAREVCIFEYDEAIKQYAQVRTREDEIARVYDAVRARIATLHWNETNAFRGAHYGVPPVLDGIHRKNDCGGRVVTRTISSRAPTDSTVEHVRVINVCDKCHAVTD